MLFVLVVHRFVPAPYLNDSFYDLGSSSSRSKYSSYKYLFQVNTYLNISQYISIYIYIYIYIFYIYIYIYIYIIDTKEKGHQNDVNERRSDVLVNFGHILHHFLVFLLLT